MKEVIPNVGNRLTYTFHSISIPEEVPTEAVTHKLDKDRVFELELFSQPEMRELRNRFRLGLQRRGVGASGKKIDEIFNKVMGGVAQKVDFDINKQGVGHIVGEDRRFGDGRDSQEWFYVVNWPSGNRLRERLGFSEADFHVTLGMTGNGVHDYAKDESTLIDDYKHGQQSLKKLFVDDDDRRGFTESKNLTELGNTTDGYDYRVTQAKGYESVGYEFRTPDNLYTVRGYRDSDEYIEIGFDTDGTEGVAGVTNKGNQFRVLATVLNISQEIWNRRNEFFEEADRLKGFMYSGYHKRDEDYGEISKRDKFYRQFIKRQYPSADISYDGAVTRVTIK